MTRMTSLLPLMTLAFAACAPASRPASTPGSSPITNQQPITRFQLHPVHVPGPEGRHSSSQSSSELTGSLELVGDRARLVLEIETSVGYIGCPSDPKFRPAHQACYEHGKEPAPQHSRYTRALTGPASWQHGDLVVEVSQEVQPNPARPPFTIQLALACTEANTGLLCKITDRNAFELSQLSELQFSRGPVAADRGMVGVR